MAARGNALIRFGTPAAYSGTAKFAVNRLPAARPADLYDDPVLKQVLQEFDGKVVGVEDGND